MLAPTESPSSLRRLIMPHWLFHIPPRQLPLPICIQSPGIRASLVVQMVKNLPAMQETWVWFLSWEYPLEEDMATHSSTLAWRVPKDRGAWRATVHGVTDSHT